MKNTSLVVKSNDLVEASYKLTLVELRIVFALISTVRPDDVNFKKIKFKVADFAKLIGVKNKNIYAQIREYTTGLMSKPFFIGENLQVNWLASAEYMPNEGAIELEFSEKLKPFLLQLKEKFTSFKLLDILSLKSAHSMRIYELLKQYEKIGYRQFTIEKLKSTMGLSDEYPIYYDFKKRVILVAIKEINEHTDLLIDYEEIKESKKVTKIKFLISSKLALPPRIDVTPPPAEDEGTTDRLKKFGLTEAQISECLNQYDDAYINVNLDVVEQAVAQGKVKRVAAYTLAALRDNYSSMTIIELEKKLEQKRSNWRNQMRTEYYQDNTRRLHELIQDTEAYSKIKAAFLKSKQDKMGLSEEALEDPDSPVREQFMAFVTHLLLEKYTFNHFLADRGFYDMEKKEILYPESL